MPHQCVRCSTLYDDGSEAILKGCSCGCRLFFFIKKEKLEQMQKAEETAPLTEEAKVQIEHDVYDILGTDRSDEPVILDIESIKILEPGKYELDLVHLFKGDSLIFKVAEGKYIIDIPETFNRMRKK